MSDILNDSRFTKYLKDPRYRQIPKHERKVTLDKRFKSMFENEKFKVKYTVDKRGRPVNDTSTENLRKYYDLEESDVEDTDLVSDKAIKEDEAYEASPGQFVKRQQDHEKDNQSHDFHNDELIRGKLDLKTKNKLLDLEIDYARGEGILQTDSSSEEEDTDLEEESELEHEWGELDADAETTESSTKRIAICNMDWDNIKAIDLMVLLNSFLPQGGFIHKISVYPSEYGLKRMQEEDVRGPIELTEDKADELSDDGGHEEGSTYHMEKLRRYQLNRLKYYYAVVECDSIATADKLYNECDGMEYESSATRLDMRFIPDDTTFDQVPREVSTKMPDMTKYKSRLFTTTALQQAKVELTWDTTNPNRTEVIKSALDGKIDDLEINDYLASSSESEYDDNAHTSILEDDNPIENESEDPIKKYKMLLEDIEKKDEKKNNQDMELEITWGLGIKDKAEELVKKKINEETKELTPFQKLLKKRQEKRKQKNLKQKGKLEQEEHSNCDESQSDDIPSDIDMNDSYFAEEFNKPEFKKMHSKETRKDKSQETHVDEENNKLELELLLDDDDGKEHFSLKTIQAAENNTNKNKRKKKIKEKTKDQSSLPDFEINVNDARFSAIFNSHLFNIDPSDSNFKKTKNMEKLIHEKLKRRPVDSIEDEQKVSAKQSKKDVELNILLKNIKRKTKDVIMKQ